MLTPDQEKYYWESKIESDKWFWFIIGGSFIGIILIAIGFIFTAPQFTQAQEIQAPEPTSTPKIIIELTDTEKLALTQIELDEKNQLVSKYAMQYDSCKNSQELLRQIKLLLE